MFHLMHRLSTISLRFPWEKLMKSKGYFKAHNSTSTYASSPTIEFATYLKIISHKLQINGNALWEFNSWISSCAYISNFWVVYKFKALWCNFYAEHDDIRTIRTIHKLFEENLATGFAFTNNFLNVTICMNE